jgi:integrin beta 2
MFFTKWGTIKPTLERMELDGTERKTLVNGKIIYPNGLTLDFPLGHIYWVDSYLDYVERVDYNGNHRMTIKMGFPVSLL